MYVRARLHSPIYAINWYALAHEATKATIARVIDWVAGGRCTFHDLGQLYCAAFPTVIIQWREVVCDQTKRHRDEYVVREV